MRIRGIALCVFLLSLVFAPSANAAEEATSARVTTIPSAATTLIKLEAFAWLAGSWVIVDGDKRVDESWTTPAGDLMIGMSRSVRGDKTTSFEFMRIAARSDGVFYIAQPHGKPAVEFPLESWNGSEAVFINPGNGDHLQRIIYRKNPDGSLTARIEGENAGKKFAEDYAYKRPQ